MNSYVEAKGLVINYLEGASCFSLNKEIKKNITVGWLLGFNSVSTAMVISQGEQGW